MKFGFNIGENVKPKMSFGNSVNSRMNIGPTIIGGGGQPQPSDPTAVHSPDSSCTKVYACSQAHYNELVYNGELEADALYIIVRESGTV